MYSSFRNGALGVLITARTTSRKVKAPTDTGNRTHDSMPVFAETLFALLVGCPVV